MPRPFASPDPLPHRPRGWVADLPAPSPAWQRVHVQHRLTRAVLASAPVGGEVAAVEAHRAAIDRTFGSLGAFLEHLERMWRHQFSTALDLDMDTAPVVSGTNVQRAWASVACHDHALVAVLAAYRHHPSLARRRPQARPTALPGVVP